MTIAVILAAGRSRRLKGINKIFYKINKKPLIFYTLLAFEKNPQINKVILVTREKFFKNIFSLIKKYKLKKVAKIIKGGKERQDSSFNALKIAETLGAKPGDLILFHNGANPLISQKEIFNVIKAAKKHKAALLAHPVKDTLKKVTKNGFVIKTIDRKNIYSAQTPQVIEYKLAKTAFEKAFKKKFYGTDDIALVEKLKKRVKVVPCSYKNIKVTTREDLEIIEKLLKK
jgi:2-C-methyl-D-erythritol 4-phosphate cytidylyltransferase